jgi:CMP/dCMP kinase
MPPLVIAIDGPAGSGKSTVALAVANELGLLYVDSGAMYRAAALKAIDSGASPGDPAAVLSSFTSANIQLDAGKQGILLDGRDVTGAIRSPEVAVAASKISQIPEVRSRLIEMQRRFAHGPGVVMEGRDIGTVVFPEASVKIFLTARPKERAERRLKEQREMGRKATLEEVEREILSRDKLDAERATSPLRAAPDAITLDTTELTVPQVVERILMIVQERNLGWAK